MNPIAVYTPRKSRFEKLVTRLSALPEYGWYHCEFQQVSPSTSLSSCLTRIAFVDALLGQNLKQMAHVYYTLPDPPFLILFHDKETSKLSITEGILIFGACLNLDGNIQQELAVVLQNIQRKYPIYCINVQRQMHYVPVSNILYLKMEKHCVKFLTTETSLKSWGTLAQELEKLHPMGFCQIHRSYVINLNHICKSTSQEIYLTGDIILPVGRKYKQSLALEYQNFIEKKSL